MSFSAAFLWLAGAVLVFILVRSMLNVEVRYRDGVAIVIGVLWPVLLLALAAFLLLDLAEWLVRKRRRREP